MCFLCKLPKKYGYAKDEVKMILSVKNGMIYYKKQRAWEAIVRKKNVATTRVNLTKES